MLDARVLDAFTDALPADPGGASVPRLHVILRRMSRGLSVRLVLLRTHEHKPPVPMGRLHVSATLWRTVLEPGLRVMETRGRCVLTVDDAAV